MGNNAGKGDKYRKVDMKKWDENYDKIFARRKTINDWAEHFGDRIKSWDGPFRKYGIDDLLTKEEYELGIVHCSIYGSERKIAEL
jgi:hypothetical protein